LYSLIELAFAVVADSLDWLEATTSKEYIVKILVTSAFCCLLAGMAGVSLANDGVSSTMSATAAELMERGLEDEQAYALVASLTTEVGPRLAGSEAEARAREWAVDTLNDLGFANVRVEPFEVPLWERGKEHAEILAPFPQALTISTLGGSASTGPEGVEGKVVSFSSLKDLRKASVDDVKDSIVFVDEIMGRSKDGSGYALAVGKRRETAYLAQTLGAKAALIRSVGTSTHRFAHTGQMRRILDEGESGVPTAALTGPDADQLQRALAYGETVKLKLIITPQTHPLSTSGNVIAEIVGREKPDEIVLIGAHLDSWDIGTGAVDDGAGVGIAVAAAKILLDHLEQAPRRTIRIVLFGSEEVGLVGGKAYADHYGDVLDKHVVASESDFGAGDIWRFDTRVAEGKLSLMQEVQDVIARLGIERGNNQGYGGPDLKYLREAGVPVVSFVQDGSDYFDLHHTANDTLDKIGREELRQNVAAYASFLYLAAEMENSFR
jgi:carboxypeptidase Q